MQRPYNNHSFLPLNVLNVLNYSQLLSITLDSFTLYSFTPHRYRREVATRRKLHEKCMELEGNIRVFCRSRPVLPVDGTDAESNKVVVACTANGKNLLSVESFAVWILLSVESIAVWFFDGWCFRLTWNTPDVSALHLQERTPTKQRSC